jgi:transposase
VVGARGDLNYSRVTYAAVPTLRAVPIELHAAERARLKQRADGHKTPYQDRLRARIVLLAARGRPNAQIAGQLGITTDTARKWRTRFAEHRLAGLADRPRSGRPRRISALERAEVCALACQLPAATGVPLAHWTCPELAAELVARGVVSAVSASSVRRILAENPIKPWQHESWIFIRDPDFAAKATVVLDLYAGTFGGQRLGADEHVISIDAKPSIQARRRCHHPTPPLPGKAMRVEHEYQRAGALALLAGLDIRTGQVLGSCPPATGITPFMALVDQILSQQPYQNAKRVFVVVDNGSDHRGKAAVKRLARKHPNAVLVHTPVHASWLNQIEIFFSIIQKKVVSPNDFTDTAELARTLLAFIDRYNTTARPFNWKFTAADLTELLARTQAHQAATQESINEPKAA